MAKKKWRLFSDTGWKRKATIRPSHGTSTSALSDVCFTSLTALKESADAFPPLKSTVGAVLAIWTTVEKVKHSREAAEALTRRAIEILEALADAIDDPTSIDPRLQEDIRRFELLLNEIQLSMRYLASRGPISRFMRLNRAESDLAFYQQRLDDLYKAFTIGSTTRVEVKLTRVYGDMIDTKQKVEVVVAISKKTHERLQLLSGVLFV